MNLTNVKTWNASIHGGSNNSSQIGKANTLFSTIPLHYFRLQLYLYFAVNTIKCPMEWPFGIIEWTTEPAGYSDVHAYS